jgi:hypothetical protein
MTAFSQASPVRSGSGTPLKGVTYLTRTVGRASGQPYPVEIAVFCGVAGSAYLLLRLPSSPAPSAPGPCRRTRGRSTRCTDSRLPEASKTLQCRGARPVPGQRASSARPPQNAPSAHVAAHWPTSPHCTRDATMAASVAQSEGARGNYSGFRAPFVRWLEHAAQRPPRERPQREVSNNRGRSKTPGANGCGVRPPARSPKKTRRSACAG